MLDEKIIKSLRGLSIDMIDNVKSGHPGVCLGACPILYTLYSRHMNISLENDKWTNRDRFVLSGGHASALLYSMLYYLGYLSIEDLKQFRTLNSNTPGHPEITTKGVDMSTGPLGEGIGNAVGIAISEKYLETTLGSDYINYNTYVMCGDGDLEEGVSYEALSLAGTLNLNKLIILYDSNDISLDGKTNITFNDNIKSRFESIGFNYIKVFDAENIDEIDKAINNAKNSNKPSIIEIKSVIGKYSMLEGTNKVHGSPLSSEDIASIKDKMNISHEPFYVDLDLVNEFRSNIKNRCNMYDSNKDEYVLDALNTEVNVFDLVSPFYKDMNESLRETNGKIMNVISNNTNMFIGGAADLSSSTKTYLENKGIFSSSDYSGRNIFYGVREHAMGSISNGIASTGILSFASTFMSFSDHAKPAIRMSALMNLPVVYVFTHDSITIGYDGATHEPIEQLSNLRNIPNFRVFRPCDANEILGCWDIILKDKKPSALILSRNASPLLNSDKENIKNGGYIVRRENGRLNGIIISSGTEVYTSCMIADELEKESINIRVVSMVSTNIFDKMSNEYKNSIIPIGYKVFAIEYSSDNYWYKYTNNVINITSFGKSGSEKDILKYFKLDKDSIKEYIKNNI